MLHIAVDDAQAWYEHVRTIIESNSFPSANEDEPRVDPPKMEEDRGQLVTVTVFLASTSEDPQPGDLPAIILADPDFISSLEPEGMSVDEARDSGVEVRVKIELPPDGRLVPANTLRHLLTLRQTDPG